LKVVFNALGCNFFATGQDKASKDTFFVMHFIFQGNLGLIIAD
jgi:hypothetical protein